MKALKANSNNKWNEICITSITYTTQPLVTQFLPKLRYYRQKLLNCSSIMLICRGANMFYCKMQRYLVHIVLHFFIVKCGALFSQCVNQHEQYLSWVLWIPKGISPWSIHGLRKTGHSNNLPLLLFLLFLLSFFFLCFTVILVSSVEMMAMLHKQISYCLYRLFENCKPDKCFRVEICRKKRTKSNRIFVN